MNEIFNSNIQSILHNLKTALGKLTGSEISFNNDKELTEIVLEIAEILEDIKNQQDARSINYENLPVITNYNNFFFLRREDKLKIKFEELNKQVLKYYLINDFGMFCLVVYQQIEAILDTFLGLMNNIETDKPKKYKLDIFFNYVEESENKPIHKEIIESVMDLRDFTSHADKYGASLDEKIKQRYKWVYIELKVSRNIEQATIKNVFKKFLGLYIKDYDKHIKVKRVENANYSFKVEIGGGLSYEYLEVETIVKEIQEQQAYKLAFGNDFSIQRNFYQYVSPREKYLINFIENRNFQEVNSMLNWLFDKFSDIYYQYSTKG